MNSWLMSMVLVVINRVDRFYSLCNSLYMNLPKVGDELKLNVDALGWVEAKIIYEQQWKYTIEIKDPKTVAFADVEKSEFVTCPSDWSYVVLGNVDLSEVCVHEFKQYQGFTESYQYCTKCDIKE